MRFSGTNVLSCKVDWASTQHVSNPLPFPWTTDSFINKWVAMQKRHFQDIFGIRMASSSRTEEATQRSDWRDASHQGHIRKNAVTGRKWLRRRWTYYREHKTARRRAWKKLDSSTEHGEQRRPDFLISFGRRKMNAADRIHNGRLHGKYFDVSLFWRRVPWLRMPNGRPAGRGSQGSRSVTVQLTSSCPGTSVHVLQQPVTFTRCDVTTTLLLLLYVHLQ